MNDILETLKTLLPDCTIKLISNYTISVTKNNTTLTMLVDFKIMENYIKEDKIKYGRDITDLFLNSLANKINEQLNKI